MKKVLSFVLCLLMIFSTVSMSFAAASTEQRNVRVSGKYHQTQARSLLSKINKLRLNKVTSTDPNKYAGDQAWAWEWDAKNKTYFKQTYNTLKAYTYDYELEEIAMQRAAEIAVYYGADHTRPNGSSWRTAHTQYNPAAGISIGENIFATTNCDVMDSAAAAFDWWLEAEDLYDGQSHRRNLLGVEYPFVCTAFACFEVNEVYYWVELFRSKNINAKATTVSTDTQTKSVTLSNQFVKNISLSASTTSLSMSIDDSRTLLPTGTLISTNHILSYIDTATGETVQEPTVIQVEAALSSSNTNVVSVAGNTVKAVNAGSAVITATAFGATIKYNITVKKTDISSALITLEQDSDTFIYTGEPIYPKIAAVQLGSKKLSTEDYTVSYADNTAIGTGVITVTGKGNYKGTLTKAFQIINKADCKHVIVYDPAVEGTCLVKGKTSGTHCKICGKVIEKQEETTKGPHKEKTVVTAKAATCTQAGCTIETICEICGKRIKQSEKIPALGHKYPANYTTVKATLKKNGSVYRVCSRCKNKEVKKTIYYPKTFTLSKKAFTYNGKVQKPKFAVKGADGKTISTAHFTYSIPNGKNVGRYKITVKFKGVYSGTKYLYFDILPKNTPAFKLSSAKKAFKVNWTTQKVQTTGYQIQYSLYANFKSAKTFTLKSPKYNAATISKLAGGKKYYVRIRTYRALKFEGKNINLFSPWSGKKSITTKK